MFKWQSIPEEKLAAIKSTSSQKERFCSVVYTDALDIAQKKGRLYVLFETAFKSVAYCQYAIIGLVLYGEEAYLSCFCDAVFPHFSAQ